MIFTVFKRLVTISSSAGQARNSYFFLAVLFSFSTSARNMLIATCFLSAGSKFIK
jgi:hypothetical protein